MSEVKVKENESLDSALRRFKRTCARDGIIQTDIFFKTQKPRGLELIRK